jgi:hypothetical protein
VKSVPAASAKRGRCTNSSSTRIADLDRRIAAGGGSGESSMNPVPGAVVMGIGGATLIVAGVLAGLAKSELDSALELCEGNVCPASQESSVESARGKAIGADVCFGIGGAAVVTGLILLFTIESEEGGTAKLAEAP